MSVSTSTLIALLGPWSEGPAPLYAQLAAALERATVRGDVPAGARLPSERQLAAALGVSRTTVVAAYDRLRTADVLRSRRGSGTLVARGAPAWPLPPGRGAPTGAFEGPDDGPFALEPGADEIELTIGALPGAPLIAEEAVRMAREDLPGLLSIAGYEPFGLPALRAAVARHLQEQGLPTSPEEILVTSGAQQAIDLLARNFGGPGATVYVEDPTYPPAIGAFRTAGARLVGIPVDELGLRVDLLRSHVAPRTGQLLFVDPTCHNPTGTTMHVDRRRELVRLADDLDLLLIDDETSVHLAYDGTIPPPLATFDREGRVLTIGSLSKIAWGGLRIGWIRAPDPLVHRLAVTKVALDFSTSPVTQAIAVRLLARLDELVPRARNAARGRFDVLEAALRLRLPGWTWMQPAGGLSLWVQLPGGDASSFARQAARYGVAVRPGPQFSPSGAHADRLRIAFGHEPALLEEAVRRLAAGWSDYRPRGRPQPRVTITV